MIPNKIINLIAGKKINALTLDEQEELTQWIEMSKQNKEIYEYILKNDNWSKDLLFLDSINVDVALDKVLTQIHKVNKPIALWKRFGFVSGAAAVLLIFFATIIWQVVSNNEEVVPGSNKAILTLADGTVISLDESQKELVLSDSLFYGDGTSFKDYDIDSQKYLEITTPKGGEYTIVLADKTKIRLNADSKVRFPRFFSSNERRVELVGEAYFEVSKDVKPFLVESSQQVVRVLGTTFNISAYPEDKQTFTTLVEGQVSVANVRDKHSSSVLLPGQQSIVKESEEILIKYVDIENYISWTKNQFVFIAEPLDKAIQKIARWYNLDYRFEKEKLKAETIEGILPRYSSAEELFDLLEQSGNINIKIENKTIIIY